MQHLRRLPPDDLLGRYERHLVPHGLTAAFGAGIALTDGLIHHQDIRRSLARPRAVPAERLVRVLPFALRSPVLPARRNARGLHLIATDLDWMHGRGPEVTGPGESLLMAIAGRAQAMDGLEGPGVATLATRLADVDPSRQG